MHTGMARMRRLLLSLVLLPLMATPPAGVAQGTDVPREFFPLMAELPGFSGPPADGSRVVMGGQLALSVHRTYHADSGGAEVRAQLQASTAMAETWRRELRAAGAHRRRIAGFPAVSRSASGSAVSRVVVKLHGSPFALFILEAHGEDESAAIALAQRFPLEAMRDAFAPC